MGSLHAPFPPALPPVAGIGLRAPHVLDIIECRPAIGWLEAHPENYMGDGGTPHVQLNAIRQDYDLSFHAVGLSLGSAKGVNTAHVRRLRDLAHRYEPTLVSDHLSWSVSGGIYLNDLLPLPLTEEALGVLCANVDAVQSALGRRILVENPSTYIAFEYSPMPEPEFLAELSRRTGCGLLLDVNNIYVSAMNLGFDPRNYLMAVPGDRVEEIHLAGHAVTQRGGREVRIDDHGSPVCDAVWQLFAEAVWRFGPRPTLIEWDTDIPPLVTLLAEAEMADRYLLNCREDGE